MKTYQRTNSKGLNKHTISNRLSKSKDKIKTKVGRFKVVESRLISRPKRTSPKLNRRERGKKIVHQHLVELGLSLINAGKVKAFAVSPNNLS